jgi:hypothetical protein
MNRLKFASSRGDKGRRTSAPVLEIVVGAAA